MRTTMLPGVLALLLLGTAACGDDATTDARAADRIAADRPAAEAPSDTPVAEEPAQPSTGMCAPGVTDCVDTAEPTGEPTGEPDPGEPVGEPQAGESPAEGGDEFPTEDAREEARALLGTSEAELPDDVRIARRGGEQFMLTEDYVLGRMTVELDDTDGSGHRVVTVTVELPDGPETFHLAAS